MYLSFAILYLTEIDRNQLKNLVKTDHLKLL